MLVGKKPESVIDDIHYHNFKGVDKAKSLIHSFRNEGKPVLVYFDPDIDGLISGYFVCKALSLMGMKFNWYINSNREHGFFLSKNRIKGLNIIAVDFLITPSELKDIVDCGCNILSIDHHVNVNKFIEYESNDGKYRGCVINNQYRFEEESSRYLSGAGVVFEVFKELLGDDFATRENRALVGLTLLSDIRNIENRNARSYLQTLYNHPYKGYIKYLIEHTIGEVDYGFGVPRLDRNYVDYTLSPTINACLRFNQEDMVVEFILGSGFLDKSYHKEQKELVDIICKNSKVVEYENLRVVIIKEKVIESLYAGASNIISNFVGVTASRFLDGSKSVIAYVISNGKIKRVSFRGRVNGLNYLESVFGVLEGIGHESAFGIINLKPSDELFLTVDEKFKDLEEGSDYSKKYVTTSNISMFVHRRGYEIGLENTYCLSQNRTYVKYIGNNVKVRRSGKNYKEYVIDGVSVMCFNNELDPCRDMILPILERGNLCLYLECKPD